MISIEQASQDLSQGKILGIPTDTVYGLAADYLNEEAVEKLYAIKGRESQKAIIILAATRAELQSLVLDPLPEWADSFWPGPLSLVVCADTTKIPSRVRSNLPTIGIRIPNHPLALALLEKTGPLAVTSANPSGRPPATTSNEVREYFGDSLSFIEGGEAPVGLASTVLQLDPFQIFREGTITKDEIEKYL